MRQHFTKNIKRLVVKVGTSVLTRDGHFDKTVLGDLAAELAAFIRNGVDVFIVSSGAIGAGMSILKLKARPAAMEGLQASAAVGQRYLMQCYEEAFSKHGISTGQVLLTWEDLAHPKRFLNAKRTLLQIQKWGLVPVINENDTVATDEIRFGDNDRLSSLLAVLMEADVLVILSDTNGFYREGCSGRPECRIPLVDKMESAVFSHARESKNSFTVGGMAAKLKAIEAGVEAGIPVFLADGRESKVLSRIFEGEDIGTLFVPKKRSQGDWVSHFLKHVRSISDSRKEARSR
ncbi:MAG: glutamate 5-kinase [Candidatus Omnitrophica bacterium]|nr:glutamate 5-kinase [Candidatus Omnitrophota bacterium]